MSPLIAVATWQRQLTFLPLFALGLLGVQITFNRQVRRAAQDGVGLSTSEPSVRWPAWATPTVMVVTIIGLQTVMFLPATTTWWQVIWVTYLVCGAAAWVSRLSTCRNPECRLCGSRWVERHPSAAAGVRYAAWALALAAPGLAALLPVTAGHAGTALLLLTLYLTFAPLPNRGSQRWLWARRPAAQVAVRGAPLVVLSAINFAREPAFWVTPVVVAVVLVLIAARLEVRRSRARNAATRRHLLDRIRGDSAGLDASVTQG